MAGLLIEARIPYGNLKDVLPDEMRQRPGSIIGSGTGTTVHYRGMVETRGADIAPVLEFVMDVAAGVTAAAIAGWIRDKLGRAQSVTINRRQVDLDDKGQIRRIIDEELKKGWQDESGDAE